MIANTRKLIKHKPELVLFSIVSIGISILLVLRAIHVPMAHDEIATFFYFVQNGKFSPFFSNYDTNNHFLNSFLIWISYQLTGNSPLSLRLPNLLFIPVFFYALYHITRLLKNNILQILTFTSIALTLHFIEFLALARGYGMSMAMMLLSLMYILLWKNELKQKYLIKSLLSIFVASLANLALINFYVLLLTFVFYWQFIANKRFNIKAILYFIIFGALPFTFIVAQILYIKSNAGLIAGSPENFWNTTIASLFGYLFELNKPFSSIVPALLFGWILTVLVILLVYRKKKKINYFSNGVLLIYFFVGSISITLLLGILFHVNYPDDRIATYLYPLAIFCLVFLSDELIEDTSKKISLLFVSPLLLIFVHFFLYLNLSYSIWYKYDVIPKRFYTTVMEDLKPGITPPTIAAHGMRIFCWSYLSYLDQGNASSIFFTTFPSYKSDFQIVNLKMIPNWNKFYDTIDYDEISERHLLKLKEKPIISTIIEHKNIIHNSDNEYIVLAEGKTDSLFNKCIQVDFNLALNAMQIPLNARVVVDISDNQLNSLCYEYIQLNWLKANWNDSGIPFNNCILVDNVPSEATTYKIYIWNIEKSAISVEGKVTLNEREIKSFLQKE